MESFLYFTTGRKKPFILILYSYFWLVSYFIVLLVQKCLLWGSFPHGLMKSIYAYERWKAGCLLFRSECNSFPLRLAFGLLQPPPFCHHLHPVSFLDASTSRSVVNELIPPSEVKTRFQQHLRSFGALVHRLHRAFLPGLSFLFFDT